jgi:hypothetical protein
MVIHLWQWLAQDPWLPSTRQFIMMDSMMLIPSGRMEAIAPIDKLLFGIHAKVRKNQPSSSKPKVALPG